jgi:general secretion pathway protein G
MMQRKEQRGFTLIEVLVVLVIIATLATAAMLFMRDQPGEARMKRALSDIQVIETGLDAFKLNMMRYPDEEEGLEALITAPDSDDSSRWKGPYLKRLPTDPWGEPYIYLNPGQNNPDSFDIVTYGLDKQEGGEGENADIGNWEAATEAAASTKGAK